MLKKKISKLKWKTMRALATFFGYVVYDPTVTWMHDEDFKKSSGHTVPGIPGDRSFVLFDVSRKIVLIPGDIAECGSRHGRSACFILDGLAGKKDCTFHVFDSFAGLSEPTMQDQVHNGKPLWSAGDLATPVSVFKKNLEKYLKRIVIHQGWIPERFNEVSDCTFSLVHIDVDLYEPTLQALEFFYQRTSPGGVIICDDYGSSSCPGSKKAFDEFFADKEEALLHLPTAQSIVVKK